MKKNYILPLIGILLLSISCQEDKKPAPLPKNLPVVEVKITDVASDYVFPTNIEGVNNFAVRAKIAGYINKINVDEGDQVTKGQVLFELETNIQDQTANAANSQVDAANSNIEASKSAVEAAQIEYNKLVPLVEKNIISSVQLETAKSKLEGAKSRLSQAKANYNSAQANYYSIQENINFAKIKSPIDGVIGRFNYRLGALVSPQDPNPITQVSDVNEVYAYFTLNEKQYIQFFKATAGNNLKEKLEGLDNISLELADGSLYNKKGVIETTTGQIDQTTGTIEFRVKFDNSSSLLSNGSTGKVLIPRLYKDVLVIPESATFAQQGYTYAFKLQGDSVVNTLVQPTDRLKNLVIIEEGLKSGDVIVAAGVQSLKNGQKIKPELENMDQYIKIEKVE